MDYSTNSLTKRKLEHSDTDEPSHKVKKIEDSTLVFNISFKSTDVTSDEIFEHASENANLKFSDTDKLSHKISKIEDSIPLPSMFSSSKNKDVISGEIVSNTIVNLNIENGRTSEYCLKIINIEDTSLLSDIPSSTENNSVASDKIYKQALINAKTDYSDLDNSCHKISQINHIVRLSDIPSSTQSNSATIDGIVDHASENINTEVITVLLDNFPTKIKDETFNIIIDDTSVNAKIEFIDLNEQSCKISKFEHTSSPLDLSLFSKNKNVTLDEIIEDANVNINTEYTDSNECYHEISKTVDTTLLSDIPLIFKREDTTTNRTVDYENINSISNYYDANEPCYEILKIEDVALFLEIPLSTDSSEVTSDIFIDTATLNATIIDTDADKSYDKISTIEDTVTLLDVSSSFKRTDLTSDVHIDYNSNNPKSKYCDTNKHYHKIPEIEDVALFLDIPLSTNSSYVTSDIIIDTATLNAKIIDTVTDKSCDKISTIEDTVTLLDDSSSFKRTNLTSDEHIDYNSNNPKSKYCDTNKHCHKIPKIEDVALFLDIPLPINSSGVTSDIIIDTANLNARIIDTDTDKSCDKISTIEDTVTLSDDSSNFNRKDITPDKPVDHKSINSNIEFCDIHEPCHEIPKIEDSIPLSDNSSSIKSNIVTFNENINHATIIANHYNAIEEKGLSQRNQSHIVYIRNFNNWIKSVLIKKYVRKVSGENDEKKCRRNKFKKSKRRHSDSASSPKIRVLDMCCGKGGDLLKWKKANIYRLICADIAEVSVKQCQKRYEAQLNKKRSLSFKAEFLTYDCTKVHLREQFKDPNVSLDLVSCQFALHYAFESISKAEGILENASRNLKSGGFFIGTVPNANELKARWNKSQDNKFGNRIYSVDFQCDKGNPPIFGAKYNFYLEGVVDCPEFLIDLCTLKELALKFDLELILFEGFEDFYERMKRDNYRLLRKMGVLYPPYFKNSRRRKVKRFTWSEWDVITLYSIFAFEKRNIGGNGKNEPYNELLKNKDFPAVIKPKIEDTVTLSNISSSSKSNTMSCDEIVENTTVSINIEYTDSNEPCNEISKIEDTTTPLSHIPLHTKSKDVSFDEIAVASLNVKTANVENSDTIEPCHKISKIEDTSVLSHIPSSTKNVSFDETVDHASENIKRDDTDKPCHKISKIEDTIEPSEIFPSFKRKDITSDEIVDHESINASSMYCDISEPYHTIPKIDKDESHNKFLKNKDFSQPSIERDKISNPEGSDMTIPNQKQWIYEMTLDASGVL